MKKSLIYALSLALLLSLAACHKPQADQPAEPQEPEIQQTEPVSTEPTTEPVEVKEGNPESGAAEPPADTTPEQPADAAPETPAEKPQEVILPNPPETDTEPEQSQEPAEQQQTQQNQQTQQPTSSTQKIDGHDDLGDYVLNGKGGKYYPALGITLPVSYDGKTHEGIDFSQSPDYKVGVDTAEEHTESWNGVSMGG